MYDRTTRNRTTIGLWDELASNFIYVIMSKWYHYNCWCYESSRWSCSAYTSNSHLIVVVGHPTIGIKAPLVILTMAFGETHYALTVVICHTTMIAFWTEFESPTAWLRIAGSNHDQSCQCQKNHAQLELHLACPTSWLSSPLRNFPSPGCFNLGVRCLNALLKLFAARLNIRLWSLERWWD